MDDWRKTLAESFEREEIEERRMAATANANNAAAIQFFAEVVFPASRELQQGLQTFGREVTYLPEMAVPTTRKTTLTVNCDGNFEFSYEVAVDVGRLGFYPEATWRFPFRDPGEVQRAEAYIISTGKSLDEWKPTGRIGREPLGASAKQEDIIGSFLKAWHARTPK